MRKVFMFNMVSLDGFFAKPKGEIDWHNVDEEFNQTAADMIQQFDTILFGRVTYSIFEDYWPNAASDPQISKENKIIANKINEMTKVFFSKPLNEVTWNNSVLFRGDLEDEVMNLKRAEGCDIVIYGSGNIVQQLIDAGLIDEYRFMVNPVVLSNSKALFKDIKESMMESMILAKSNYATTLKNLEKVHRLVAIIALNADWRRQFERCSDSQELYWR